MPRIAKEFEDKHIADAIPVMLGMIQRGGSVASVCKAICDEISELKPLTLERSWRRWTSPNSATRTLPTFLRLVPIVRVARVKGWLGADLEGDVRALVELVEVHDRGIREAWRRSTQRQLKRVVAGAVSSYCRITWQPEVAVEETLKLIGDVLAESLAGLWDADDIGYGRRLDGSIDSGLSHMRKALRHEVSQTLIWDVTHSGLHEYQAMDEVVFPEIAEDPPKLGQNWRKL